MKQNYLGCTRIVQCDQSLQQIYLFKPGEQGGGVPRTFTFDVVYGEEST